MPLFSRFRKQMGIETDSSSDEEIEDKSAKELSYVGYAAYDVLRKKHKTYHKELWNVTKGKIIELDYTPKDAFTRDDSTNPVTGHSDWFPQKIEELIGKTTEWCDVLSLAPPDGLFMTAFKNGLRQICYNVTDTNKKVVIRMMFGNIPAMPINITKVMEELTKDLPSDANKKIKMWVGSWRKGASWNHSKIIAIDGKHLWTGGHNFWDRHYLKKNPTNDVSITIEGHVARDGHRYANAEWSYIVKKQNTAWGNFVDKRIPDGMDVPRTARVTVSNFPENSTTDFPPIYSMKKYQRAAAKKNNFIPEEELSLIITMGRYGRILKEDRPSDDAFVAMFRSAKTSIRCALQDLGPACVPKTKKALPGLTWPEPYLNAFANVMWTKGVDVEIVLSNPCSIPDGLPMTEAQYGNGWNCVDVAAEIIKRIKEQFPTAPDWRLREVVQDNLRVCFIKCQRGGSYYADGGTLGLHSKHFIIDDRTCFIGSQNLYKCDLAEWGVVIDTPDTVSSIKDQYWDPMWKVSYTRDDCNVDKVMDGLGINRGAATKAEMTMYEYEEAKKMLKGGRNQSHYDSDESSDSDAEDEHEQLVGEEGSRSMKAPKPAIDPNKPPPYWIQQDGKKVRNPEHIKYMKQKYK